MNKTVLYINLVRRCKIYTGWEEAIRQGTFQSRIPSFCTLANKKLHLPNNPFYTKIRWHSLVGCCGHVKGWGRSVWCRERLEGAGRRSASPTDWGQRPPACTSTWTCRHHLLGAWAAGWPERAWCRGDEHILSEERSAQVWTAGRGENRGGCKRGSVLYRCILGNLLW